MLSDYKVKFAGTVFSCLDCGFAKNENVDVVIRRGCGRDEAEKGMLCGMVTSVTFKGVHYEIIVDINGFKWMIQTTDFVDKGKDIGLYIEPTRYT